MDRVFVLHSDRCSNFRGDFDHRKFNHQAGELSAPLPGCSYVGDRINWGWSAIHAFQQFCSDNKRAGWASRPDRRPALHLIHEKPGDPSGRRSSGSGLRRLHPQRRNGQARGLGQSTGRGRHAAASLRWRIVGAAATPKIKFERDDGHNHFHLIDAADYALWNQTRTEQISGGFTLGFCLVDTEQVEDDVGPSDCHLSDYD